jgi:hypothetical protein
VAPRLVVVSGGSWSVLNRGTPASRVRCSPSHPARWELGTPRKRNKRRSDLAAPQAREEDEAKGSCAYHSASEREALGGSEEAGASGGGAGAARV